LLLEANSLVLPVAKKICFAANSTFALSSTVAFFSGQPLLAAVPASDGHLSLSSFTPSPSVSGTGQPL